MTDIEIEVRREAIAEIDAKIIELIRERSRKSAKLQARRVAAGGSRVDVSQEKVVIGRYALAFGSRGADAAFALLDLARSAEL